MSERIPVLVVDDERGLRDLLQRELTARGFEVTTACDGAEAIALLSSRRFRLAICDIRMPKADGLQVLTAAKRLDPEIEVILATGYGDVETAVVAMKKGACDFVQKPYNVEEVGLLAERAVATSNLRARLALSEAEALNTLGLMAAGVAHDLNNPLTAILGFVEIALERPGLSGEARKDVDMIGEHARRCRDIARSLLDFARRVPRRLEPLALQDVAAKALQSIHADVQRCGATTNLVAPDDSVRVNADAVMLQQVIVNLTANSLHAMEAAPRRHLEVTVRVEKSQAVLEVADTGCGIDEKTMQSIFLPFFTTKPSGKGTGLGLAVCQLAVRQHGGTIHVDSRPGGGATFTVRLPLLSGGVEARHDV